MLIYSAVSRGRLMQIGLQKCDLGVPSHRFTESVTTITVRELSDTPRTSQKCTAIDIPCCNGNAHEAYQVTDNFVSLTQ
jgi:hypothetical protein